MMKDWISFALALAGSLLAQSAALAAEPPTALDAQAARAIVDGCVAEARSRMQSHSIVVVDRGGHIVAALRMNGNPSGTFDFALAKAEAAASWGFSTAQMLESVKGTPGFANAPHVVTVAGGVPILSADGKTEVGAVGVSGEAPADDAACAEAGIRAAGFRRSGG